VGARVPSFHGAMGALAWSEADSTHMTFCRATAVFISETQQEYLGQYMLYDQKTKYLGDNIIPTSYNIKITTSKTMYFGSYVTHN
jgi:hypothetical protein